MTNPMSTQLGSRGPSTESVLKGATLDRPALANHEIETTYAAFNDPTFFEPLFASGEIHSALRDQIEEPLHIGTLWSVRKFVQFHNEERERTGRSVKYGFMIVRKQVVLRCAWEDVNQDELNTATI